MNLKIIVALVILFLISAGVPLTSSSFYQMDDSMDLQTLDDENLPMPLTVIELLNEDFSGTFLPDGWNEDEDMEWYQEYCNNAGGTMPEATADCYTILGSYAYLRTVPVDSTDVSLLTLEYKSCILDYAGVPTYSCYVKIRADSGDTWTDITPWSNPISSNVGELGNTILNTHTIDVSSDIGTATQVMFEFVGESGDFDCWFLDDVKLIGEEVIKTRVSIQPPSWMVEKGETFTVSVYVEPTELIMGVTMGSLSFDPTLIQANSVSEGDLFDGYLMWDPGIIDPVAGTITDAYVLALASDAVSDHGSFVDITFTALYTFGTSELVLEGMIVASVASGELPVEIVNNGVIIVVDMCNLFINVDGCGTTDPPAGSYPCGTAITIEAIPCSNWEFVGWSGDINTMDNPTAIIVFDGMSITAHFEPIMYTLNIQVIGCGQVEPPGGVYPAGTAPCLVPIPCPGWSFLEWTGDVSSMDVPLCLTMDGDKYITAVFINIPPWIHPLSIIPSDPLDTIIGWENFSVDVTDNDGVDEVKLIVTNPDDSVTEYPMTKLVGTDKYYVNITLTDDGCHIYHIWADDIYDNDNTSASQQFELPPNEDVDMNGQIHFMDLVAIALMYNDCGPPGSIREDVDNNGCAHFMDLVAVVLRYGEYWDQC